MAKVFPSPATIYGGKKTKPKVPLEISKDSRLVHQFYDSKEASKRSKATVTKFDEDGKIISVLETRWTDAQKKQAKELAAKRAVIKAKEKARKLKQLAKKKAKLLRLSALKELN
jgi:hypothetical protein